jgi:hypothetical protein
MKALIELMALGLLPCLVRLCRSSNRIRVRVRLRRTPRTSVLVSVAVLIVIFAAAAHHR